MIVRSIIVSLLIFLPALQAVPCPDVPEGGCSVCGEGRCVNAPDVEIADFLPPSVASNIFTCGELQQAGYESYDDGTFDICGNSGVDLFASAQLVTVCDCRHTLSDDKEDVSVWLEWNFCGDSTVIGKFHSLD